MTTYEWTKGEEEIYIPNNMRMPTYVVNKLIWYKGVIVGCICDAELETGSWSQVELDANQMNSLSAKGRLNFSGLDRGAGIVQWAEAQSRELLNREKGSIGKIVDLIDHGETTVVVGEADKPERDTAKGKGIHGKHGEGWRPQTKKREQVSVVLPEYGAELKLYSEDAWLQEATELLSEIQEEFGENITKSKPLAQPKPDLPQKMLSGNETLGDTHGVELSAPVKQPKPKASSGKTYDIHLDTTYTEKYHKIEDAFRMFSNILGDGRIAGEVAWETVMEPVLAQVYGEVLPANNAELVVLLKNQVEIGRRVYNLVKKNTLKLENSGVQLKGLWIRGIGSGGWGLGPEYQMKGLYEVEGADDVGIPTRTWRDLKRAGVDGVHMKNAVMKVAREYLGSWIGDSMGPGGHIRNVPLAWYEKDNLNKSWEEAILLGKYRLVTLWNVAERWGTYRVYEQLPANDTYWNLEVKHYDVKERLFKSYGVDMSAYGAFGALKWGLPEELIEGVGYISGNGRIRLRWGILQTMLMGCRAAAMIEEFNSHYGDTDFKIWKQPVESRIGS